MRWVPEWLGQCYARLSLEFGTRSFTANECSKVIEKKLSSARVVLSKLSREGYLLKRRVGGRVEYSCIDPYEVLLRCCLDLKLKEEYLPLAYEFLVQALKFLGDDLVSVVLYGSIARGDTHECSDMDLLLVARNLPRKFSERIEYLYPIKRRCSRRKIELWREKGIYCSIQIYPLLPSELKKFRPLFLDIVTDGVILFDRGNFMRRMMSQWRQKLKRAGAKKVVLPDKRWYWVLKPEIRRGEVIEL